MDVPAFCDTCGTAFASGIAADNSFHITLKNCTAGPCPSCGGMGHVPDGVFNFMGNTIEVLSAPQRTRDELSHLAKILRDAKEQRKSPDEVAQTIRNEIPELSGIADLVPKTRSELYAFLGLTISAVTLIIQIAAGSPKSTTININQTVTQVFSDVQKPAATPKQATKMPAKKVGRNASCPCGSGKKFKRCCGAVR